MPIDATAAFPPNGLATERLLLRTPRSSDAYAVLAYYIGNRAHLRRWEPARTPAFYTEAAIAERLEQMALQMETGRALHLLIVRRDTGALVGNCNFSNIVRGHAQSCHLGFGLGMQFEGQGLMHEALAPALRHMFEVQGLHRIVANHLPENLRCERLLARLGFEREGLARAYLHIDGAWRDHVLNALINDDPAMA
jgi:ribosomal-protein-alanine N-acetyltransferase